MAGICINKSFAIVILFFTTYSCSPKIYEFNTTPLAVTSDDSIFVKWRVRGKPVLIVHNKKLEKSSTEAEDEGHTSYQELTLVVTKNGKEIKSKKQITVLPKDSRDIIVFNTILAGDTLIAQGINNTEIWGDSFQVVLVNSASGRALLVTHAAKKAELNATGTYSNAFEGTPVKGLWEFRSLLTSQEKKDLSIAPASLRINITIKKKSQ